MTVYSSLHNTELLINDKRECKIYNIEKYLKGFWGEGNHEKLYDKGARREIDSQEENVRDVIRDGLESGN